MKFIPLPSLLSENIRTGGNEPAGGEESVPPGAPYIVVPRGQGVAHRTLYTAYHNTIDEMTTGVLSALLERHGMGLACPVSPLPVSCIVVVLLPASCTVVVLLLASSFLSSCPGH